MIMKILNEERRIMYPSDGTKKRIACEIACERCGGGHWVDKRKLNRLKDGFICKECKHIEATVEVKCAYCGAVFRRTTSKIKNSKSGIYFCCREHKDLGQQIESGITEIHPDHYNTGIHNYRATARREYDNRCEICGYDEDVDILQVHHIDCNRNNNAVSNLMIICPNCHAKAHNKKYIITERNLFKSGD